MPIFNTIFFILSCILIFGLLMVAGMQNFNFAGFLLENNKLDIRLVVMLLLAEPHFAFTLPLLFGYRKNFERKRLLYCYVPFAIICLSLFLFFFATPFFFLIFLFANVYHVNRQSVGFLKLQYRPSEFISSFYELILHSFTITCLYFARVQQMHDTRLAFMLFFVFLLPMILIVKHQTGSWPNVRSILVFSQGLLIFSPIVVFEDILLAFAVGISIHYIQYLTITWRVCRRGFGYSVFPLLAFLLFYSLLSTGALGGFFTNVRISTIVFVPTILQLLHFYYDGLIWRRSDGLVGKTMKSSLASSN